MRYCICVSGGLGYIVLQHLCEHHVDVACVLTDSKSDGIIAYCHENGLPYYAGNPRNGRADVWMEQSGIIFDNLLSINYLFILEADILKRAKLAINFHGSLLPKYRGRTPHVWAIINGEKECGITAHLMNTECDDGDIVRQIHVHIDDEDTGADILNKYNALYPELVIGIVRDVESGAITYVKQDKTKATYFGKRTPADGHIEWSWQKERIRNWVRAQAYPYPGAFSYVNGEKVIINKLQYSDFGFNCEMENGLVIGFEDCKPVVKTQNGAVVLIDVSSENIKLGDILK